MSDDCVHIYWQLLTKGAWDTCTWRCWTCGLIDSTGGIFGERKHHHPRGIWTADEAGRWRMPEAGGLLRVAVYAVTLMARSTTRPTLDPVERRSTTFIGSSWQTFAPPVPAGARQEGGPKR